MRDKVAQMYADGGSRGNPGPAGVGAVIIVDGKTESSVSQFIGNATNNVAEYTGLILGLERALEIGLKEIEVLMDSELVVKQMNGLYKVKNAGLAPLFIKAQALSNKFSSFKIAHVRRESNRLADKLANEAMDRAVR